MTNLRKSWLAGIQALSLVMCLQLYGLALQTIVNWPDGMPVENAQLLRPA